MGVGPLLARLGVDAALRADLPTLRRLHRAWRTHVPYENVDIQLGGVAGAETRVSPVTTLDGMAVVKINAIEVPEDAGPELERRFANRLHAVDGQPGFLSFELLRPVSGDNRYFVVTHWEDDESFQAWMKGSGMQAHSGERARPVSTGSSLLEFEVVQQSRAGGA